MKRCDSALYAIVSATKEIMDVKKKTDILENQNVLILFTADQTDIVSKDAREYLALKRMVEVKKLRRMLVVEEEFE